MEKLLKALRRLYYGFLALFQGWINPPLKPASVRVRVGAVAFWHGNGYRTGAIVREFDNGSLEVEQDAPFSGLIRVNPKKSVVLAPKSGESMEVFPGATLKALPRGILTVFA